MATTGHGPAAGSPGGTIGKAAFGIAGPPPDPEPEPLNPDADIRRLVTIDPTTGEVTVVKNLEVDGKYHAARGSWNIKAPTRTTSTAGTGNRYHGTQAVHEQHANAEVTWKALVKGTSPDDCLQNLEVLIASFEPLWREDTYIEWVPVGASQPTYYPVRGPATWQHNYEWGQWYGAVSLTVEVTVPVAPLAEGETFDIELASFTAPAVIELDTTVNGTAPALADITANKPSATDGPAFALFAWWNRLPTPGSTIHQAYGLIDASNILTGTSLSTWTATANAGARGGTYPAVSTSGAGTGSGKYGLSTEGLDGPTVDIEVWARVRLSTGSVSPRVQVKAYNNQGSGTGQGAVFYTREWGQTGRPLVVPGATGFKLTRVGILTLPVGTRVSTDWVLEASMSWQAGSSGTVGLDWLLLVPPDACVRSPTGEALDDSYPRFMADSTAAASKTITSTLSGVLTKSGVAAASPGLSGAPIWLPPGDVDLAVLFSKTPPDVASSVDEAADMASTGTVRVTPRYYVINGGN